MKAQSGVGQQGWARKPEAVEPELEKARELQGERRPDRGQHLPYQGLAAAPGRQRTPASRAWSWPHCVPAMGALGALRAMGWVLKQTQTLQAVGEAHGILFTHTLLANTLWEDPRPTGETLCWQEDPLSPLKGLCQGCWREVQSTGWGVLEQPWWGGTTQPPWPRKPLQRDCMLDGEDVCWAERASTAGSARFSSPLKELLVQQAANQINL